MLIRQLLETPRRKRSQDIPQEPRDHVVIYNGFALVPQLLTRSEAELMATRSDLVLSISDAYKKYKDDSYMGRNIYKMALVAGILKQ